MGKGVAGYNTRLYVTGTSTGMVDEACTEVSGTVFQVTDTAKQIIDADVAVVVEVDAVVEPAANWSLDYNTGTITFTSSQTGSTVTVTASYLPRHLVANIQTQELQLMWDTDDSTCQGDEGEDITPTILRSTLIFEAVQLLDTVYDGGTESLDDTFTGSNKVRVLEYQPNTTTGRIFRGRYVGTEANISHGGPATISKSRMTWRGSSGDGTLFSTIAA